MDRPSPEIPPWPGVCGATINCNGTSLQVPRPNAHVGSATSVASANIRRLLLPVIYPSPLLLLFVQKLKKAADPFPDQRPPSASVSLSHLVDSYVNLIFSRTTSARTGTPS